MLVNRETGSTIDNRDDADDIPLVDKDNPLLKLVNLEFSYNQVGRDELRVFSGLNESFNCGELTTILGPSGCGKTTLLDIIAGIQKPTNGKLLWQRSELKLGYLFQEYPFLPRMNVVQHLSFPLRMAGKSTDFIRNEVDTWLRKVGLSNRKSQTINELSVGMKARVALATVLISRPYVLLLDEPFRALDLETRVHMWNQLKMASREQGYTTLLVTHDLDEAIALSDRILILSHIPARVIASELMPFENTLSPIQRLATNESGVIYQRLWDNLRTAFANNFNE
jgi:NitT/TauT family transport system ATP-binding protein